MTHVNTEASALTLLAEEPRLGQTSIPDWSIHNEITSQQLTIDYDLRAVGYGDSIIVINSA